jgi:hypothetical protein
MSVSDWSESASLTPIAYAHGSPKPVVVPDETPDAPTTFCLPRYDN